MALFYYSRKTGDSRKKGSRENMLYNPVHLTVWKYNSIKRHLIALHEYMEEPV